MGYFGHYLLKRGALKRSQLEEALQASVVCGGRLGTSILELGYLPVDALAQYLTDYTGVPLPPPERLASPSPEALDCIPARLACELTAFPFEVGADRIHLVMLDPRDSSQLRRISKAAQREARGFILPEVLIHLLLEQHLGVRAERRMARLAESMRKERVGTPRSDATASEPDRPPVAEALPEGEELIDEASFAELQERLVRRALGHQEPSIFSDDATSTPLGARDAAPADDGIVLLVDAASTDVPCPVEAPPANPAELANLEARLAAAADRDEIGALAVRIARAYAAHAALFLVHGETVLGFRGSDEDLDRRIQGVMVPLATACTLARVAARRERFRGAPPAHPLDTRVWSAVGRGDAHDLLLLPICIRDRAVNVLYVDNGGDALAETAVAALAALGNLVAEAYERLILASKRAEQL